MIDHGLLIIGLSSDGGALLINRQPATLRPSLRAAINRQPTTMVPELITTDNRQLGVGAE